MRTELLIDNKKIKQIPNLSDKDKDRFWSKISIGEKDECWDWQCTIEIISGYGAFHLSTKDGFFKAHRVSYFLSFGEIPKGLLVLHSCDRRCCVNPNHLFLGTTKDNADDMIKKGRNNPQTGMNHWANRNPELVPRGERNGMTKLNNNIVLSIRNNNLVEQGLNKMEIYDLLANKYSISPSVIRRVLKRQIWKHI